MIKKVLTTPQHCVISGRPIKHFGGKNDKEKSGIHTELGAVHNDGYPEYVDITTEVKAHVQKTLGNKNYMPMSKAANRVATEMGKFCIREKISPKEAIPFFRDHLNNIKG